MFVCQTLKIIIYQLLKKTNRRKTVNITLVMLNGSRRVYTRPVVYCLVFCFMMDTGVMEFELVVGPMVPLKPDHKITVQRRRNVYYESSL